MLRSGDDEKAIQFSIASKPGTIGWQNLLAAIFLQRPRADSTILANSQHIRAAHAASCFEHCHRCIGALHRPAKAAPTPTACKSLSHRRTAPIESNMRWKSPNSYLLFEVHAKASNPDLPVEALRQSEQSICVVYIVPCRLVAKMAENSPHVLT